MKEYSTQTIEALERYNPQKAVAEADNVIQREPLVSVVEIAALFNVHLRTAQRWTKNRQIPHYRVGNSVRYNKREVLRAVSTP